METTPLPDDVVAATCHHMNSDHADDALLIVQRIAGVADAEQVETVGLDSAALHLIAITGNQRTEVSVPFATEVTDRASVRAAVADLARRARAVDDNE